MKAPRTDLVEIHVFRRRGRKFEFLVLQRSPGRRLSYVWQPVTGKLRRGESVLAGAAREVREETGLVPRRWWALESMIAYFDPRSGRAVLLPVLAAQVGPRDQVRLSREHRDYEFLGAAAAARKFLWDQQRQALTALRREILPGGPRARALEITGFVNSRGAPRRAR